MSHFSGTTIRYALIRNRFCASAHAGVVFIIKNEISYLALSPVKKGIVVIGSSYGFNAPTEACWLGKTSIYYLKQP